MDVVRKRDKLYKSYTIHQTGHSLGGFVAEFGAAYVANPNPKFPKLPANMDSYDHHFRLHTPRPKDANAITFDSLGSVNILRKLGISELQAHTVNYLPKASIVNTANPHDGLRYLLTDVITTNSSASVTFSFVAETAKNLREIIDSKDSHSIDYIISLFSQETEYPNFSVCVSGWPAAINVFLTAPTPIVPKVPVMNPPNNILNILQNVGTGLFFIGTVAAAEVVHGMTGIVQFEHTRTGSIVPINGNKAPSPILTSYGMSGRATGRTHMTTNVVNPVKISNNTQ